MAKFDPSRPYDALPPLPPKADIETRAILRLCRGTRGSRRVQASRHGDSQPKRAHQYHSAARGQLRDREYRHHHRRAVQIRPARRGQCRRCDQEALRYRTALRQGVESLKDRPLSTSTAIKVCSTIKGREMEIRRVPGTALTSSAKGAVIPPVGEARCAKASPMAALYPRADRDRPAHPQGGRALPVRSHPSVYGRQWPTGRVLNQLMLVEQGLLDLPVLYLSRYVIHHKANYYRLLLAVTRDAAWEKWILYMLAGVRDTAEWMTAKIEAIRGLMEHTTEHVRSRAPKIYSRELVDGFRTAVLPNPEYRRGRFRPSPDRVRLPEDLSRDRRLARDQSRAGEALRAPRVRRPADQRGPAFHALLGAAPR